MDQSQIRPQSSYEEEENIDFNNLLQTGKQLMDQFGLGFQDVFDFAVKLDDLKLGEQFDIYKIFEMFNQALEYLRNEQQQKFTLIIHSINRILHENKEILIQKFGSEAIEKIEQEITDIVKTQQRYSRILKEPQEIEEQMQMGNLFGNQDSPLFKQNYEQKFLQEKCVQKSQQINEEMKKYQIYLQGIEEGKRQEKIKMESKLEAILKRLEQLENKQVYFEDELNKIKEQLQWDQNFPLALEKLNKSGKLKVQIYARNLCWMICVSVQSYRGLKLGLLSQGSNIQRSRAGNFCSKVCRILNMGSKLPFINSFCQISSSLLNIFLGQERKLVIGKISEATSQYYTQKLLAKQVTNSIYKYILSNDKMINVIEEEREHEWKILRHFTEKRDKIMAYITNIECESIQQKRAIVDCSLIMASLLEAEGNNKIEISIKNWSEIKMVNNSLIQKQNSLIQKQTLEIRPQAKPQIEIQSEIKPKKNRIKQESIEEEQPCYGNCSLM